MLVLSSLAFDCGFDTKHERIANNTVDHSLEKIAESVKNATFIQIAPPGVTINSMVKFTNLSNIVIYGHGAVITCNSSSDTGLLFVNTHRLCLSNFTLSNCSGLTGDHFGKDLRHYVPTRAAMIIEGGSEVTATRITVTSSTGTGLFFMNTGGTVIIEKSQFFHNKVLSNQTGYAGLHVLLSGARAQYKISNSSFLKNDVNDTDRGERGSGLGIFLVSNATGNQVNLYGLNFSDNSAQGEGSAFGVYLVGSVHNNTVTATDCKLSNNSCYECNGAGVRLYLKSAGEHNAKDNTVCFDSCQFHRNIAQSGRGGGLAVLVTKGNPTLKSWSLKFIDTVWEFNRAWRGAAIDISPVQWFHDSDGYQPEIIFTNCTISNNLVTNESMYCGIGAMSISDFTVTFSLSMIFEDNNGSALVLMNAGLTIIPGARLRFTNNTGSLGGAILLERSWVFIDGSNDGVVEAVFVNNCALYNGGAVAIIGSRRNAHPCFLMCQKEQNIDLTFINNKAGVKSYEHMMLTRFTAAGSGYGDALYATTLMPCRCINNWNETRSDFEVFSHICSKCKIMEKSEKATDEPQAHRMSTAAAKIQLTSEHPFEVIPGKDMMLNLSAYDEFDSLIETSYKVIVMDSDAGVILDNKYAQISNPSIKLYGHPGNRAVVRLEAYGGKRLVEHIDIKMGYCPPGYVFTNKSMGQACLCGNRFDNETHRRYYEFILYCSDHLFAAKLPIGIWAGYVNTSNVTDLLSEHFRMAVCPLGYCNLSHNTYLPSRASPTELENTICVHARMGRLCAECRENMTTFFHSSLFSCKGTEFCSFGPLFFILTELLPLTILFLTIVFFNIDFSSGGISSFILFAQIQAMLHFDSANPDFVYDAIYNSTQDYIYFTYGIVYGFFSLEFFTIEPLSFCLWPNANPLQMLVVKYISTVYALLLVIGLVVFLKYCSCCQCWRRLMQWRQRKGYTHSFTHAIVAFLTLSYAQCTSVTIQLLTIAYVEGEGGLSSDLWVYYYGKFKFFDVDHIVYAIPALVFLVTFVLVPPFLLMSYPLCHQVMALLHISETSMGLCVTRWIEKLKPLFDAFQNRFKDRYRFTAGIHYLYRVAIPAMFATVMYIHHFYLASIILLVSGLLFHSIVQPYQARKDNVYHALVMADLALIAAMGMYNYNASLQNKSNQNVVYLLFVLISLPVVSSLSYFVFKLGCLCFQSFKNCHKQSREGRVEMEDEGGLPYLQVEGRENSTN